MKPMNAEPMNVLHKSWRLTLLAFVLLFAQGFFSGLSASSHNWIAELDIRRPAVTWLQDPRTDTISVNIQATESFWGQTRGTTENIRFTVNDSKKWVNGEITFIQKAQEYWNYSIKSTGLFAFTDTINTIFIYINHPGDPARDTIIERTIRYTKPVVKLKSVNGTPPIPDAPFVVNGLDGVNLELELSVFGNQSPGEFDKIEALFGKHTNATAYRLLRSFGTAGIHSQTLSISLSEIVNNLQPGLNRIEFYAKGRCAGGCDERSDVVFIDIFYLSFEVEGAYGGVVCQDPDGLVRLRGIPAGGYFSGNGILENTVFFKPHTPGIHTITYHYSIGNKAYSHTRYVVVEKPGKLELTGSWEVCRNEYAVYKIDTEYDTAFLQINISGGKLELRENKQLVVHWSGTNAWSQDYSQQIGLIQVKSTGACPILKEFLVEITEMGVPDVPDVQLVNNNLLVSSNTTAREYRWYHRNELQPIAVTNVPYYFLGENAGLVAGDRFWVEIANSPNMLGCYVFSHPYEYFPNKSIDTADRISAYPNPCIHVLTVSARNLQDDLVYAELYDQFGRLRWTQKIQAANGTVYFNLNCSEFPPGIYLVRTTSREGVFTQKIYINSAR